MLSIPLILALGLSTTGQAPTTASLVGRETSAVLRAQLAGWDIPTTLRQTLGKVVDDSEVAKVADGLVKWTTALRNAGAKEFSLLFDLGGRPMIVVPLADGVKPDAIVQVLTTDTIPGLTWPAAETIRGAVVGATAETLKSLRDAPPQARPEVDAAIASTGDAVVSVLIVPSLTVRRSIEESLPTLPEALGGDPITTVSGGLSWASVSIRFNPGPSVRAVVQAKDPAAAKALTQVVQKGLGYVADQARKNPDYATLANVLVSLKPETKGDTILIVANLNQTADLLAVPARQAQDAARRGQCVNNLKQIGLALHNYHSAYDSFPPAFRASKDGKPLLSWRVLILPYLEQKPLYDEFHLDEAWDSPHNKTLIARMPKVYNCPGGSRTLARSGKTAYLTARGSESIFPGTKSVGIREINDGTSNTIMVIDASDAAAVPWTQPTDWDVPDDFMPRSIFGHHLRGTNVLFADGSVHFLKETIAATTWRYLLSRSGGEVINRKDY